MHPHTGYCEQAGGTNPATISPPKPMSLHTCISSVAHIEKLIELMEDKKSTVKKFISEQHMSEDNKSRFTLFLTEWEKDIAYVITIKDALKSIRDNCENWKLYIKNSHQVVRMMSPDANSIANKLDEESRKEKIDINKVHAMITSFTAAKGKMIQIMRTEEAAI